MKKLLGIVVLGLILTSCSKIPKSAFNCFDTQTNKRIFTVIYDKNWSRIYSPSNWVFDGISRYNEEFWELYFDKPIHVDNGHVVEYFEDLNLNRPKKKFTISKGKNKGKIVQLPLNNYRNTYFNLKNKEFKIYEYYHPLRTTLENFKFKEDDYGFKINITFQKKFKCVEDKEIYKGWKKAGHRSTN